MDERRNQPVPAYEAATVQIRASLEGAAAQRTAAGPRAKSKDRETYSRCRSTDDEGGTGRWDGATLSAIIAGRMLNGLDPYGLARTSLVSVHKRAYFSAFTRSCADLEAPLTGMDRIKSTNCRQDGVIGTIRHTPPRAAFAG